MSKNVEEKCGKLCISSILSSKDAGSRIPKMHKNPFKHRFIAGSSKCSTKPLSILLTKLLTHIKQGLQKYCETAYSRSLKHSINTRHESIFSDPDVVTELSRLHENFVIVPADKASNNYTFVCKRYYADILIEELGLHLLPGNPYIQSYRFFCIRGFRQP